MWNITKNSVTNFDDQSAAFFTNCSQLLTASSDPGEARIWDISSIIPSLISSSTVTLFSFSSRDELSISSDGTRLLSCDGLWEIKEFQFRRLVPLQLIGTDAIFSPDCKHVVHINHGVHILDTTTGLYCIKQIIFPPAAFLFPSTPTKFVFPSMGTGSHPRHQAFANFSRCG